VFVDHHTPNDDLRNDEVTARMGGAEAPAAQSVHDLERLFYSGGLFNASWLCFEKERIANIAKTTQRRLGCSI